MTEFPSTQENNPENLKISPKNKSWFRNRKVKLKETSVLKELDATAKSISVPPQPKDKPITESPADAIPTVKQLQDKMKDAPRIGEEVREVKRKLPGLGQPVALEEAHPPRGSRMNIFAIAAMMALFILWAGITPITEVAVAPGQVVPTSLIKTIQHLEGGIIKEIKVEDGMYVKEGDTLITLDEKASTSELEQVLVHETGLRIRAERLRAFGLNQEPDFMQFNKQFQSLIDDQKTIFEMQSKNRADKSRRSKGDYPKTN